MKARKALPVDFDPIHQSMRDLCRDANDYYFNRISGKVVILSRGVLRFLTDETEELKESLPDWEAKMIPIARQIILEASPDFIRIPEAFGQPEHGWMREFSGSIRSVKLKQKILLALRGRGACRRFKEILKGFPEESRQWGQYKSLCWKEKIQIWLDGVGIIAVAHNPKHPRPSSR